MIFEWDAEKAAANLRKHGLAFEDAILVFDDPLHRSLPDPDATGEERWRTLGSAGGVILILVVHTSRHDEDREVVRVISARRATRQERRAYEQDAG